MIRATKEEIIEIQKSFSNRQILDAKRLPNQKNKQYIILSVNKNLEFTTGKVVKEKNHFEYESKSYFDSLHLAYYDFHLKR